MNGVVTHSSNFLQDEDWFFIVEDLTHEKYYVMAQPFYKNRGLKSPITKREIDSLLPGMHIKFEYIHNDAGKVITKIQY